MPTVTLATVLTNALTVVSEFGPYIMVGLAIAVAPRLLKLGFRVLKGRG